ncbi:ABC transporter ATP-binding protein [Rhodobacteraceae bacterium HSP-20]|uniref:Spermidine/putrescine import ATP-binding protein PotA n=1 Tax=Paragemmobacter amnigenus TaxID=2852097 RepID=A0ABS6IYB3_9RHOB|nr:ABC transporter ATP-binding protein [Rhodobacter amnigenus]MBU9696310.1 ABC transporter ATP-binding protein [Rhodobacter amnigenus]MBV4387537.1 ABC transporter ATP-binding protein [Rhodobacter amnigenus]
MLEIRNLTKSFGRGATSVTALSEVTFPIAEGEFFTLLGPSGCGKTTLLRLIAGFEPPSGGQLVLDGRDIARLPPNKRPVNTVFQNYALFPHMTVAENVGFALGAQGRPRSEIAATVERMLALVQLGHLAHRKSGELSGGQQQRVALARALAPKPRILLLDEPLSALDMKLRKDMQVELKRLQQETGLTFIFVTHDQEEALTMSDRIAVMNGGRIQQIATPRELYDQPANRFVASFIGESNFLDATCARGRLVLSQAAGPLPVSHPDGPVTLMVRPEHVVLGSARGGGLTLAARVERLVYFGTDTHVHLLLADGARMVARVQNALRGGAPCAEDDVIEVTLPTDALRLLPKEAG